MQAQPQIDADMGPPPRSKPSEESLYSLARAALEKHDFDGQAAANAVFEQLQGDTRLLRELVRSAVRIASQSAVGSTLGHRRNALVAACGKERVIALARGIQMSLLDMPLLGGKLLRDASREEIGETAWHYEKLSATCGVRGRWLRLIEKAVPEGRLCGDVVSSDRATALYQVAEAAK